MEGLMVTCPLTPYTSHLLSSSCSSPRSFGLSFLQTPPRDDALALLLTFGSANTWYRDSHPTRLVPCPAHTPSAHSPRPDRDLTYCSPKPLRGRGRVQRLR